MFTIKVKGNIISVQESEPITSGSVSVYKCQFTFDSAWEGFFRSAVFRVGSMVRTVPLDAEDMCDMPWELLVKQNIGLPVEVSVYGAKDETEILPTIWDKLGRVRSGSEPGEDVKAPTPNVYDQLANLVRVYAEKVMADKEATEQAVKDAEAAAASAAGSVSKIGTAVRDAEAAASAAAEAIASVEKSASIATDSADTATTASESAVTASAQAAQSESKAATYASSAQESAERAAEAKTVAESAITSASEAAAAATAAAADAATASNAATVSTSAASSAQRSADAASASASEAEAWSKKAETLAGGGVLTFNGRSGEVTPQDGDYTAAMVGADASGAAAQALSDAKGYTDEKIAAIPTPDVSGQINAHNADTTAHSDIRNAIPTKTSDLANDSGFITGYTETDPTVPAWAKTASKPAYTYSEVGAAASGHTHTPASIGAATTVTYTATVATGWTASGNYYCKNVTISGILATDNPIVDILPGSDNAANVVYAENMGKVFRIVTSANSIRLWAKSAISSAFPIQLKVVR